MDSSQRVMRLPRTWYVGRLVLMLLLLAAVSWPTALIMAAHALYQLVRPPVAYRNVQHLAQGLHAAEAKQFFLDRWDFLDRTRLMGVSQAVRRTWVWHTYPYQEGRDTDGARTATAGGLQPVRG